MISLASLRRLEQLQLTTKRRLAGAIAGEHRSARYGSTLDFADFREYVPGDDVRRVDPHHLARHGELRVKLYEADDDLTVRVLLDTSASMSMHGKDVVAADVVAAIGAVALASGDVVSLSAFPATPHTRRFSGRRALPELRNALGDLAWGGDTPFAQAARAVMSRPGPPGMTVVVSDLLTLDWSSTINRLPTRGADLLVVHVGARDESDPDLVGDLSLEDAESGHRVSVSLTDADLARYSSRRAGWLDAIRTRCHQVGGRYISLDADDDVEQTMLRSWRESGILR